MFKKLRPTLSIVLLIVALAAGLDYLLDRHKLLHQLSNISPLISLPVLALYVVMFGALVLILSASMRICRKKFAAGENAMLNAHSLFINFFVPGQGGPAYRGVYLYKRHKVKVKDYLLVTLLYYLFYAIVSVFMLFSGSRPWWQTALSLLLIAGFGALGLKVYSARLDLHKSSLDFGRISLALLFLATVFQALVQIAIYAVELHGVNGHIKFSQIVTYTGAANLALFVSLTPGAIGIRESFLIFTERLHHISSGNIIVASVIDRSVYLAFLLILLVLTVAFHLHGRFKFKNFPAQIKESLSLKSSTDS